MRGTVKLNCLIVALMLWYRTRFRSSIAVRRSEGLKGVIPHFYQVKELRGKRTIVLVDYIPRRSKATFLSQGDKFVVFNGQFRVRIYRLQGMATADSLLGAFREALIRYRARR